MLFTGTGRHRRWNRAEKAIAAAGVAGVGLALPLLAAQGATAAPVSTWEKVAQCESGGNWSINTGNGFYGGLQFTSDTWRSFGGVKYAAQAHQATKSQQIAVAERVLAAQGPGAWPVCSRRAGLAKGGPHQQADADPSSRSAAAPPVERASEPSSEAPDDQGGEYTVGPGDTLSAIAEAQRLAGGWEQLYHANRAVIGADPDLIEPGQVLRLG
ncbi:transglycosylase family protein [Kitasatospora sp. NPDC048540]|uniref:transglycosylase family protein n=1 Tax=Kitasatospora sp. NPDC048540 TaxID=3155634 RepID=UPI00340FB6DF